MVNSLAFSLWLFIVVEALYIDALFGYEKTPPHQQQSAGGLRGVISTEGSSHNGVTTAISGRNVTEDETSVDETDREQSVVATNKKLRFLLLGDWGKGGNSGKYMSSSNMTLYGNQSLEDSSDLSGKTMSTAPNGAADTNATTTVQAGGNQQALYQPQVAKAMGAYAAKANPAPSFVVAVGDNFYTKGVSSATDPLWEYLWEDVYLGYSGLNIPWYPVFGNHDYGSASAVQAQIDRYNLHMNGDIWQFPSTNYSKIFEVPGSEGASVGIVFIDSTTLAPSINGCCNSKGGISEAEQARRIKNQLYHINRMLGELVAAQVTWLLVAGHYPVFSASSSGDPTEMVSYLLPLLKKYNVHAYICGHDHISMHMQYKDYTTQFFIAGAGSMTDSLYYKSKAELVWAGPNYPAFGYMEATAKYLEFGIIDTNNDVKYRYNLTNPFALKMPQTFMPTSSPTLVPSDQNNQDSSSPALVLIAGSMAMVGILVAGVCLYGSSNAAAATKRSKKSKKEDKSLLLLQSDAAHIVSSTSTQTLPTEDLYEEKDEEHGSANLAARRLTARNERRARRKSKLAAAYEVLRDDQDLYGSDFQPKPLVLASPSQFQAPSKAPPSSPIDHQANIHTRSQSLETKRDDILSVAIGEASRSGTTTANGHGKEVGQHRRVKTMAI